ncbi:MAG: class II glutamine amidotransferase, partial [Candidatus Dadabacteria bacterium]|nr:class II glutamine amidotransferase [Candidatus Dadabacteria bacterium]
DSEHAFCWLMDQIRKRYPKRPENEKLLYRFIQKLSDEINECGIFNFMLSDSRHLYVYCSNRMCWLTRKHPFGKARLIDTGKIIDFKKLTTPKDIVTVIASRELTDNEEWNKMSRGEFMVFKDGRQIFS